MKKGWDEEEKDKEKKGGLKGRREERTSGEKIKRRRVG